MAPQHDTTIRNHIESGGLDIVQESTMTLAVLLFTGYGHIIHIAKIQLI
jgi:hypothetical protein